MPLSSQKWPGGSRSGARQGHGGAAGAPSSGEGAEQRRASGPEQGGSFKELGCLMLPCLQKIQLSQTLSTNVRDFLSLACVYQLRLSFPTAEHGRERSPSQGEFLTRSDIPGQYSD